MNKNIITLGLLASTSVMTNSSLLTTPNFELYSDNLVQKSRMANFRPQYTQISQAKIGNNFPDVSSKIFPYGGINICSAVNIEMDDNSILSSIVQRIKRSKPLPEEFSKIIDNNFWDLI